jgi:membrane fusion protein (multidrug efflux system)
MLFMLTGCERPAPPSLPPLEVPVAQVVVRDQPIVKEMVGETRGSSDIPVRARVEGVLTGMHFRPGTGPFVVMSSIGGAENGAFNSYSPVA